MNEYEIETDDFGLAFMKAHDQFIVEVLEELPSEMMVKQYRVKVQEIVENGNNNILRAKNIYS
jgi:hypothetical protein